VSGDEMGIRARQVHEHRSPEEVHDLSRLGKCSLHVTAKNFFRVSTRIAVS
jgi:hypothetical protein